MHDKKHGISGPLSLQESSPLEIFQSAIIERFLIKSSFYESEESSKDRERILGKLNYIANKVFGGRIFTFGSYRLGVHQKGADIDTLLIAPSSFAHSDFFSGFYEVLKAFSEDKNTDFGNHDAENECTMDVISSKEPCNQHNSDFESVRTAQRNSCNNDDSLVKGTMVGLPDSSLHIQNMGREDSSKNQIDSRKSGEHSQSVGHSIPSDSQTRLNDSERYLILNEQVCCKRTVKNMENTNKSLDLETTPPNAFASSLDPTQPIKRKVSAGISDVTNKRLLTTPISVNICQTTHNPLSASQIQHPIEETSFTEPLPTLGSSETISSEITINKTKGDSSNINAILSPIESSASDNLGSAVRTLEEIPVSLLQDNIELPPPEIPVRNNDGSPQNTPINISGQFPRKNGTPFHYKSSVPVLEKPELADDASEDIIGLFQRNNDTPVHYKSSAPVLEKPEPADDASEDISGLVQRNDGTPLHYKSSVPALEKPEPAVDASEDISGLVQRNNGTPVHYKSSVPVLEKPELADDRSIHISGLVQQNDDAPNPHKNPVSDPNYHHASFEPPVDVETVNRCANHKNAGPDQNRCYETELNKQNITTRADEPAHNDRNTAMHDDLVKMITGIEIVDLRKIEEAFVPLIKFEINNIPIDLLFCRVHLPDLSNLNLLDDSLLKNMDEKSILSINGSRVADLLIDLVPNTKTFHTILRAIKYWAQRRGIYGHAFGYPGGVAYAILTARICQYYPKKSPFYILKRFFEIYSVWKWPSPIMLKTIVDKKYNLKIWDPKNTPGDRMHKMPIITPAYPSICSTHNVSQTTLTVITEEFKRGLDVLNQFEIYENLFDPDVWADKIMCERILSEPNPSDEPKPPVCDNMTGHQGVPTNSDPENIVSNLSVLKTEMDGSECHHTALKDDKIFEGVKDHVQIRVSTRKSNILQLNSSESSSICPIYSSPGTNMSSIADTRKSSYLPETLYSQKAPSFDSLYNGTAEDMCMPSIPSSYSSTASPQSIIGISKDKNLSPLQPTQKSIESPQTNEIAQNSPRILVDGKTADSSDQNIRYGSTNEMPGKNSPINEENTQKQSDKSESRVKRMREFIQNFNLTLKKLFQPTDFFKRYTYFLDIKITKNEVWKGFVESRIRILCSKLESNENYAISCSISAIPFPRSFSYQNFYHFFVAIDYKEKLKLNVNKPILDFLKIIKEWDKKEEEWFINIDVRKRKDIGKFLLQYYASNKE